MRIISRQPRIDHRRSPHRGPWTLASDPPTASWLAPMLIVLAIHALGATPAAAETVQEVDEAAIPSWYTQTFTRGSSGLSVAYMWSLKSKFRAETVVRGHRLVTIVNGPTYYVYDAISQTGVAIRRRPAAVAADSPDRRPFGNEAQTLIDQGGEKVREEKLAGKRADVYQITDGDGRRIVWVTQDEDRLPIRAEFFSRKAGSTRYKEYVDWVRGLPVNDAFFQPGPSIQLEHFELDAYIEKVVEKDSTAMLPILYHELLHGPTPD